MVRRTRLKVCCIASIEEAQMAIAYGADALGLVGEMPSGPGTISDELARDIACTIPPGVESFLLTSRTRGHDIADHARFCGTTTVQIVRHIEPAEYPALMTGASVPSSSTQRQNRYSLPEVFTPPMPATPLPKLHRLDSIFAQGYVQSTNLTKQNYLRIFTDNMWPAA